MPAALPGGSGTSAGSECTEQKNHQKEPHFTPFSPPRDVFFGCPGSAAPGSAVPSLCNTVCASPSSLENQISQIYSAAAAAGIFLSANKTVRWKGGLLSHRHDFSPYCPIFSSIPLIFYHHPIFFFVLLFPFPYLFGRQIKTTRSRKHSGKNTRKSCERIKYIFLTTIFMGFFGGGGGC